VTEKVSDSSAARVWVTQTWSELLTGKVALVAGVGSGMGGSTARLLAAAGADVGAIDVVESPAADIIEEIRSVGRRGHLELGDLREPEVVAHSVRRVVEELGQLDILITVAGGMTAYQPFRAFDEGDLAGWDEIVDRNLRYVVTLTRQVLPYFLARRAGAVVYVASVAGLISAPRIAAYGAAKAALVNLTRSLAVEYGPHGIRVNNVCPGSIETEAVREQRAARGDSPSRKERIPLRDFGEPDDIAQAILFLASPLAKYVTGQSLAVDGGVSALPQLS
jgi:3-oxoacyl-[acyl-carrier protein] reductase